MNRYDKEDLQTDVDWLIGQGVDESEAESFIMGLLGKTFSEDDQYPIPCDFGTDKAEFERYVGRPPKSDEEMDEWVHYQTKGMDAQLDWDTICSCAADNFDKEDEDDDDLDEADKCKFCPSKTTNVEIIANEKGEAIETTICKSCFNKLKTAGKI